MRCPQLFTSRRVWRIISYSCLAILLGTSAFALAFAQTNPSQQSQHAAFLHRLSDAAIERTHHTVHYDPAYVRIRYPDGDVPPDTGVCTDEVIRAYRALGMDLQKEVHEDMQANFWKYPNHMRWMQLRTDTNIDHRRVPNLRIFLNGRAKACRLQITVLTTLPAISSPGISAAVSRTLASSWIANHRRTTT
jgi:uncharacterized protein YijF (DUF1287 family)